MYIPVGKGEGEGEGVREVHVYEFFSTQPSNAKRKQDPLSPLGF